MIKLIDILKEAEGEQVNQSVLAKALAELPGGIEDDLEQASTNQNEAVLTTIALAAAMPGIVKTTAKIAGIIAKKSGIDLRKRKNPAWYKVVEATADKVDSYLDTPFKKILQPFVKDDQKRAKAANILKAITLIGMSFAGSINPGDITNVKSALNNLVGTSTAEALQAAYEHGGPQLTNTVKGIMAKI